MEGNNDWNISSGTDSLSSEWIVFPQNYWLDVGSHTSPCAPVSGCTDSTALNYDPVATIDDGSCLYCVYGCTDTNAVNYNVLASCDDGSCIIPNNSIIWESDFTNASDWVIDHDASDCSLDWEIGQNLECGGFYPIAPIVSNDGYYAMIDSDEYGGEEGGTEVTP